MSILKETSIITQLRANGHRLTTARKAIISIFESQHTPISAEDINLLLIKNDIIINKSTLYREIDFLVALKKIKPVQFREKNKRYELVDLNHHHHLICNTCSKIQDFETHNCLFELETTILKQYGFVISDHILDFYGLCSECKKNINPLS
jgi:Fur family transcriptional regulator, ferric uptake regulator